MKSKEKILQTAKIIFELQKEIQNNKNVEKNKNLIEKIMMSLTIEDMLRLDYAIQQLEK